MGMIEHRRGLRLDGEAGQRIPGGLAPIEHHFESDYPVQKFLPRLVNNAHSAAANHFEQLVVPKKPGRDQFPQPVDGGRQIRLQLGREVASFRGRWLCDQFQEAVRALPPAELANLNDTTTWAGKVLVHF